MSRIMACRKPFSEVKKPSTSGKPKLTDLISTLKGVNYRYDFDQGLSEEQKKNMKRFDVFR